jgi:hypothetical protein
MRQPSVRCVEFVESVTDWMEGALGDEERLLLEEHLAICPHCTEYVGQLRLSVAVLRESGGRVPGAAPSLEARAALFDAFRRQRSA